MELKQTFVYKGSLLRRKAWRYAQPKLYSWHAPEAHCFSKGKARTPFEFGAKVGIAVTAKGNPIVVARAFGGAPVSGHTLHEQIALTTILLQDSSIKLTTAMVDLGYRCVDADNPGLTITIGARPSGWIPKGSSS